MGQISSGSVSNKANTTSGAAIEVIANGTVGAGGVTNTYSGSGFNPLYWFTNGSQGAWYDPSDLTTLFQDSAGTTPVTAVEQPVGLMLDKSKGLVFGSELVTNGDFSQGTTGWTVSGATPGWSISGGIAQVTATAAGNRWLVSSSSIVVGKTYFVTMDVTVTAGTVQPDITGTSVSVSTSGRKQWILTSTSAVFQILASSTFIGSVDNVSCKEIPGNHAFQATAGNRPTLSAKVNLLTKTEDFSDAVWTKTNSTVTVGQFLTESATTSSHNVYQTASKAALGIAYIGKIDLKPSTRSKAEVRISDVAGNGIRVPVDLSAGTIGTAATYGVGFTLTSASISTISSDGYYTVTLSGTSNSATTIDIEAWLADSAGNVSYTGDGVSGLYVRKADLRPTNIGANLPTYQRVNTSTDYDTTGFPLYLNCNGTSTAMSTNSIDFSTVTSDGQTRRNLLTYPTAFDDAAWTKSGATVSANAVVAPDGTLTADKLQEDTTTGQHQVLQSQTTTAASYTFSVYVKPSERSWVKVQVDNPVYSANFNLTTGAIGIVTGTGNAAISNAGNGWWRVSITFTGVAATPAFYIFTATGDNATNYTGTAGSGIYIWGAQLETGSTATAFQNIGTDKMTVVAGVRKLSDAATGFICELSTTFANTNTFSLGAPILGFGNYLYGSQGSGPPATAAGGSAAPISNVLTGQSAISTPLANLRINGAQAATSSATQGTGNYGNYPLYLFARGGIASWFNGYFYGLIVCGATEDINQITQAEQYMNTKTGKVY